MSRYPSAPQARAHPWRRAIIISVIGFTVAFAVGVGFALLLQSVGDWGGGLRWERTLLLRMDRSMPLMVDWIMLALPWLGTNLTLAPLIGAVALWLWRKKGRGDLALELVIAV